MLIITFYACNVFLFYLNAKTVCGWLEALFKKRNKNQKEIKTQHTHYSHAYWVISMVTTMDVSVVKPKLLNIVLNI